jgi:hypothetical protein
MTRAIAILSVILLAASAFADLTLTWDAPTNAAECGPLTYRLYASTAETNHHEIYDHDATVTGHL